MAIKYLYKCNPLVAKAARVTPFDRYEWPDGTMMLWENDLIAIDRDKFFLDNENFLADLGAVKMTDPEAFEEQNNPRIILPEARLPEYRWVQPGESSAVSDQLSEDGSGTGTDGDDTGIRASALTQSAISDQRSEIEDGAQAGKPAFHDEEGGEG